MIGTPRFANETRTKIKKIADNPEIKFDLWLMKRFNVLPTDERFLNLTYEQRELLWEDYLNDHPEIRKRIENYDPEFEKVWENPETDNLEKFEENVAEQLEHLSEDEDLIDRSEQAKEIINKIRQFGKYIDDNELEWEEVDLEELEDEGEVIE